MFDCLAINPGIKHMLAWLKRKATPAPGEQSLESEDQKPLTEERLERLLGRLGSESRAGSEPAAALYEVNPPPEIDNSAASEPAAALYEVNPPPETDSSATSEPAAALNEVDPLASADSGAADRFALRREDLTITRRGQGPSAAELLAKGYSFATGPDGKLVVFDAEGRLADPAVPLPSADSSAASEPAAGPLNEINPPTDTEGNPLPAIDRREADKAAAEALQETDLLPQTDRKRAKKRAPEALQETDPLPQTDRKRTKKPAMEALNEIGPPPGTGGKTPKERVGGFTGMRVIAVASQKGGSGKTTIAAHLAVQAGAAGRGPVVLIDTDPQGSLAEWWHARADDTPVLATVKPEELAANLAELRSYGTAVAIIDTPPALTGSIEQVIAMADLILIPVRPSPHDLRAAGGTVELARRAGKPFLFVVNSASPRASITAQAVAALSEHGRVAPVILYQRTEYAASMIDGRTVMETAASGRSAQEIAELWQCVYAQIGLRVAA